MSEAFLDSGDVRNEFIKGAYSQREMIQEFDRWLDSVKADAWEEGAETARSYYNALDQPENPYRKQEESNELSY